MQVPPVASLLSEKYMEELQGDYEEIVNLRETLSTQRAKESLDQSIELLKIFLEPPTAKSIKRKSCEVGQAGLLNYEHH